MITELKKKEAVEQEIKKFFENIDNIKSCVDIFGSIVAETVENNSKE